MAAILKKWPPNLKKPHFFLISQWIKLQSWFLCHFLCFGVWEIEWSTNQDHRSFDMAAILEKWPPIQKKWPPFTKKIIFLPNFAMDKGTKLIFVSFPMFGGMRNWIKQKSMSWVIFHGGHLEKWRPIVFLFQSLWLYSSFLFLNSNYFLSLHGSVPFLFL